MYNPLEDIKNLIYQQGGFVNAHAHIDRAYTVTEKDMKLFANNPLFFKWEFVDKIKSQSSVLDYENRISAALESQIRFGTQAICSFIDIDPVVNYTAITAVNKVKKKYPHLILKTAFQTLKGVLNPQPRKLLEDMLDDVDIIGSLPKADLNTDKHLDIVMNWAKSCNKRLHVHVDQLNSAEEKETEQLIDMTKKHGLEGRVTAIHSLSLACHPKKYRNRIYQKAADVGLSFICCPSAWIDHKRTEVLSPTHNSVTPVDELLEHDLLVALGSDNIADIYKPYCDGNMMNELRLLIDSCRVYKKEDIINITVKNGLKIIGVD